MDGLEGLIAFVGLLAWFFSSVKKKKKERQEQQRQMQTRAERRMQERASEVRTVTAAAFAETIQDEIKTIFGVPMARTELAAEHTSPEMDFRGSLPDESTEGECVCDPELDHVREPQIENNSVYANEIGKKGFVDTSAHGIMQAVVMNEILTRPIQRKKHY